MVTLYNKSTSMRMQLPVSYFDGPPCLAAQQQYRPGLHYPGQHPRDGRQRQRALFRRVPLHTQHLRAVSSRREGVRRRGGRRPGPGTKFIRKYFCPSFGLKNCLKLNFDSDTWFG